MPLVSIIIGSILLCIGLSEIIPMSSAIFISVGLQQFCIAITKAIEDSKTKRPL